MHIPIILYTGSCIFIRFVYSRERGWITYIYGYCIRYRLYMAMLCGCDCGQLLLMLCYRFGKLSDILYAY